MRRLFRVLFIGLALISSTSCIGTVDWVPVEVNFCIQDSDGNDLLDLESELFIGDQISLTHNGDEYRYTPDTKTYLPIFSGLKIYKDRYVQRYVASFGDLDGAYDYDDDFIVTLPDGSSKTIHYDRKVHELTVSAKTKWSLDGKKVDGLPITIVY